MRTESRARLERAGQQKSARIESDGVTRRTSQLARDRATSIHCERAAGCAHVQACPGDRDCTGDHKSPAVRGRTLANTKGGWENERSVT
jgi:hypothetical protein